MCEKLQNSLVELVDKTLHSIDSSTKLMEAPLPEAVEQIMAWYVVESLVYIVIGIVLISISLVIGYKAIDEVKGFFYKYVHGSLRMTFRGVIALLVGYFSGILSLWFLQHILVVLQIWVAPRVWLAECAASLVK